MLLCALIALTMAPPMQTGNMSWYGEGFHGDSTAFGEIYDMNMISVAHRTLPAGRVVLMEYHGRYSLVLVTDRGPYVSGRVFDGSRVLFKWLVREDCHLGVVPVNYWVLPFRIIRPTMLYNL